MAWNQFLTPNPGSPEAVAKGCTCPVLDNGHGRQQTRPEGWVVSMDCRMHNQETK